MKLSYILTIVMLLQFLISCGDDTKDNVPTTIEYNKSKLEYEARVKWLKEAKFGVIVHFGPGTLTGEEISWCRISDRGDGSNPYESDFCEVTRTPEEYDSLYTQFNPTKFNPDEWVDIFKNSGFNYFLFVSKHHDGFCNFETEYAYNGYNITNPNCPYGADISYELAQSSKAKDLKFGFYYSVPDWKDPDFMKSTHGRYLERMEGQIEELLAEKYSPDLMFFDSRFPVEYFNGENIVEKIWDRHPDMIINDRCLYRGDYMTPEGHLYDFNNKKMWMALYGLGRHWSYVKDDILQSKDQILTNLSRTVCNDGIFTIGIGPKPDGTIDEDHAQRILDVGTWLEKYGECIYKTAGGPYANFPQAGATYIDNVIYLHVRDWGNNIIILPKLKADIINLTALNSTNQFEISAAGDQLVISRITDEEVDGPFEVLKIETDTQIQNLSIIKWEE